MFSWIKKFLDRNKPKTPEELLTNWKVKGQVFPSGINVYRYGKLEVTTDRDGNIISHNFPKENK